MNASVELRGIYTPNIVPLNNRGDIHESELRRYVDWLIDQGVDGLYPNGSTGEFTRFTPDERKRIVTIIAEQVDGRIPILAGAAEANSKETLRACEYYAELGVRAVAIVSPFYYKLSQESVFAYFKEIAEHSPIDITLYNIPMFANPIEVSTVRRLSEECPRIIAIKDSSGDISHMIRMMSAVRPNRPDFRFFTGWEAALMPMLLIGCHGATIATSGVIPKLPCRLYKLVVAGRLTEARVLQESLISIFDSMLSMAEFPEGIREAVKLRGFDVGRSRQFQNTDDGLSASIRILRSLIDTLDEKLQSSLTFAVAGETLLTNAADNCGPTEDSKN